MDVLSSCVTIAGDAFTADMRHLERLAAELRDHLAVARARGGPAR